MHGEGGRDRASLAAPAPVGPEGAWMGGLVSPRLRLSVGTPTLGADAEVLTAYCGAGGAPRGGSQSPCTDRGAAEQREARLGEAAPGARTQGRRD